MERCWQISARWSSVGANSVKTTILPEWEASMSPSCSPLALVRIRETASCIPLNSSFSFGPAQLSSRIARPSERLSACGLLPAWRNSDESAMADPPFALYLEETNSEMRPYTSASSGEGETTTLLAMRCGR